MGLRSDTRRIKGVATPDPAEWPHSTDVNICVAQCTQAHCHIHAFLHYDGYSLIVMCVGYQFAVVAGVCLFHEKAKPVVFTWSTFNIQWVISLSSASVTWIVSGREADSSDMKVGSRCYRVVLNWVREIPGKERI